MPKPRKPKEIFLHQSKRFFATRFKGGGAHDQMHLKHVGLRAVDFLRENKASKEAEILAKVSGMFHDFDRYVPKHHLASAKAIMPFLDIMVREGKITTNERNTVLKAIVQHNAPTIRKISEVLDFQKLVKRNPFLSLGFLYFSGMRIKDIEGNVSLENLNNFVLQKVKEGKIKFFRGKPALNQELVSKAILYGDQFDRTGEYGILRACAGAAEVLKNPKVKEIYKSILDYAKKTKKRNPEEWAKKEYIKWHQGLNLAGAYDLLFKFVTFKDGRIEVYVSDFEEYFGGKSAKKLFAKQKIYKKYVDALYKNEKWAWDMTLRIFDMGKSTKETLDRFEPETPEQFRILENAKKYVSENA